MSPSAPTNSSARRQEAAKVAHVKNQKTHLMIRWFGVWHVCGCHLRVLEQRVLLDAFCEHQAVLTVSGPVQQVLHQVLVILEDPLCTDGNTH